MKDGTITTGEKVFDDKVDKNSIEYIEEKELKELEKEELEQFDDYLEMIMTYGYITLFASAFPLASTISFVFIYIESRSDLFKIEKTCRRPNSLKGNSIGSWEAILEFMAWLSIFTNVALFAYVSDQIDNIFPSLKKQKDSSADSLLTMFAFEHILFAIAIFLRIWLDSYPKWVEIFYARNAYRKKNKGTDKVQRIQSFFKQKTSGLTALGALGGLKKSD